MTTDPQPLLERYAQAILQASESMALTSDKDRLIFRERHIADAVQLMAALPTPLTASETLRVLDVGSGNGVPGIVIAILHPGWHVELIDSNNKKCSFLDAFVKNAAMPNVQIHCERAEILGHKAQRESYDLVFARALGKLQVALELTLPFLKPEGRLIVSHGTSWQETLKESGNALKILHACFETSISYEVAGHGTFYALIFSKQGQTPERYPRRVGTPDKRPL